jgi:transcriptional regulator with XRE-family HTH domain
MRDEPRIDALKLAERLRFRRLAKRLPLRKAAQESGVSAATFSRVERGGHLPERENLFKLLRWADIEIDEVRSDVPAGVQEAHTGETESTPEAVAVHLRADPDLSPQDARVLAELFRSAYEVLRKKRQKE